MSSKASSVKDYQGNIFQFFIFLVALVIYLFLYDRSLELFLQDIKHVVDLNFKDHHFLNAVFWIVGFWGIIVLLNSNNKYTKILFWSVLILSSIINFTYLKIQKVPFSHSNSADFINVMKQICSIATVDLVKLVAINAIMIILAFILKPLSVSCDKILAISLVVVIALSFIISNGQSIQVVYFVPVVFCYKYILVLYYWIKGAIFSSGK